MRRAALILLLGVALGGAGFSGLYYTRTARWRELMREPQPELAWLRREFNLGDAEFARVSQLHAAYLPQCAARCQHIEELNQKLRLLLSQAAGVTSEIQDLLVERAKLRADCETEMMKHFLQVSRTMPPGQGQRYLAWVEDQTVLRGLPMEERHHSAHGNHSAHQHPM